MSKTKEQIEAERAQIEELVRKVVDALLEEINN